MSCVRVTLVSPEGHADQASRHSVAKSMAKAVLEPGLTRERVRARRQR